MKKLQTYADIEYEIVSLSGCDLKICRGCTVKLSPLKKLMGRFFDIMGNQMAKLKLLNLGNPGL